MNSSINIFISILPISIQGWFILLFSFSFDYLNNCISNYRYWTNYYPFEIFWQRDTWGIRRKKTCFLSKETNATVL